MRKIKKVGISIIALVVLGLGLLFSDTAFAANTGTNNSFVLNGNFPYSGTAWLRTADDANNVYATLSMPASTQAYAKFRTQRLNSSEAWVDVETLYGGLASCPAGVAHDASVAFNGYAYKGTYIRVVVDLYFNSDYTGLEQEQTSSPWLR